MKTKGKVISLLICISMLMQFLSMVAFASEESYTVVLGDTGTWPGDIVAYYGVHDSVEDEGAQNALIYNSDYYDECIDERQTPYINFRSMTTGEVYGFDLGASPLKYISMDDGDEGFDLEFDVPAELPFDTYYTTIMTYPPESKEVDPDVKPIVFVIECLDVMGIAEEPVEPDTTIFEAYLPPASGVVGGITTICNIQNLVPEEMVFGLVYASDVYAEYIANEAMFNFANEEGMWSCYAPTPLISTGEGFDLDVYIPDDILIGTYQVTAELDIAMEKGAEDVKPYRFIIEGFDVMGAGGSGGGSSSGGGGGGAVVVPTAEPVPEQSGFVYEITDCEVTITGYDESLSGDVEIPEYIDGYPVTAIGNDAFSWCTSITSVTIPNSVTAIGDYAFYSCYDLTNVNIPEGVESIGYAAFRQCKNLTDVTIPGSVMCINGETFEGCISLTNVNIPESVESIGYGAFWGCEGLTDVTIPGSVKSIGDEVFDSCYNLKNVTICEGVTHVGYRMFDCCESLQSITIPASVTYIDSCAFYACDALSDVYYTGTQEEWNAISIGEYNDPLLDATVYYALEPYEYIIENGEITIIDCDTSITGDLEIPASIGGLPVTKIGDRVFFGCSNLRNITIPDSVTAIGEQAFTRCYALGDVYYVGTYEKWNAISIGSGNNSLSSATIHYASGLYKYTIENGEATITDCDDTVSGGLEIPSSFEGYPVTAIGEKVFYWNKSLTNVIIPDSVQIIGSGAFYSCTSLASVTIGNGVTTIGNSAFNGCSKLSNVTIGDKVTSIEAYAFYFCAITEITIPKSVKNIGSGVFSGCEDLTDVYFEGTQEEWNEISISAGNDPLLNATIHFAEEAEVTVFEATLPNQEATQGEILTIENIQHLIPEHMTFGLIYASTGYEEYIESDAVFVFEGKESSGEYHYSSTPLICEEYGTYHLEIPVPADLKNDTYKLTIELPIATAKDADDVKPYKFTIEEFVVTGGNEGGDDVTESDIIFSVADTTNLLPVSGAQIAIVSPDGDISEKIVSDSDGNASLPLPNGTYTVQVMSSGYDVRTFTVEKTDEKYEFSVYLNKNPLVKVETSVKEMTKQEMIDAGIDIDAADNKHVYKCVTVLKFVPVTDGGSGDFNPIEIDFDYIYDEDGTIISGEPAYYDDMIIYPVAKDVYLIIHSEVTWLKEMFDVQLVIANTSAIETIKDCEINLNLPYGLSLATMVDEEQSLVVNVAEVAPQETKDIHWYVRGDQAGTYIISGDIVGIREGGGITEKLKASFTMHDPITVLAGDAMKLLIEAEKYATVGEPYKVRYTLQNVSSKTLYDVSLNALGGKFCKAYSVEELIHNGELVNLEGLGGTFNNGVELKDEEFKPGEVLSGVFEITFGQGITTEYIEYMVSEMFTFTGDGSTTTIPTEIVLVDFVEDHEFDGGQVTVEPTCTTEGKMVFTCGICGGIEEVILPKTDHVLGNWIISIEPTCIDKGEKYRACANCSYTETAEIAESEHKFDDGEITVEPTCTAVGIKLYTCEVCGETKEGAVPKASHALGAWVTTKEATCTEKGEMYSQCQNCVYKKTAEIQEKSHSYDDGIITKEPTETEEGIKTYTCSVCGATMTEKLDKLPTTDDNVGITVGDITVRAGKEITVPVAIKNNVGLTGLQLECEYDADVLTLTEIELSEALGDMDFTFPGKLEANPVTLLWDSVDADYSNGDIALLKFMVSDEAEVGKYVVAITVRAACDQNVEDVNINVSDGVVIVIDYTPGDVDDDGRINAKDVVLIRRHIAGGYGVQIIDNAADVDESGKTDAKDVILMRRFIAGGFGVELN